MGPNNQIYLNSLTEGHTKLRITEGDLEVDTIKSFFHSYHVAEMIAYLLSRMFGILVLFVLEELQKLTRNEYPDAHLISQKKKNKYIYNTVHFYTSYLIR